MYGDTSVIRHLAHGLHERAGDIRAEADLLAGLAETCPWIGLTADALRARARAQAAALRRCADQHGEAAQALLDHAASVDHAVEVIAALHDKAHRLIDGARARLSALAGAAGEAGDAVADRADEVLASFVPPPPGHPAWLQVDLPGLAA